MARAAAGGGVGWRRATSPPTHADGCGGRCVGSGPHAHPLVWAGLCCAGKGEGGGRLAAACAGAGSACTWPGRVRSAHTDRQSCTPPLLPACLHASSQSWRQCRAPGQQHPSFNPAPRAPTKEWPASNALHPTSYRASKQSLAASRHCRPTDHTLCVLSATCGVRANRSPCLPFFTYARP